MAIERNQILVASYKVSLDLNFKMDLFLRQLLQHTRSLPDREPNKRAVFADQFPSRRKRLSVACRVAFRSSASARVR